MQTPIPPSVLLTFWLNAWKRRQISDSDARNALEFVTNSALALPQSIDYAIATPHEVILTRADVMARDTSGRWTYLTRENTVGFPDLNFARKSFFDAISASADALTTLDISGSREEVDNAMAELEHQHLPHIDEREYTAFHNALRTRVAAHHAQTHSAAVASRSQDVARIEILTRLENACVEFMCAIASTA